MAVITLITDFGTRDAYVGVMKGVILTVDPGATIVDITHEVPPQDLQQAARELADAFAYFPGGTIHLIVVDPGVGTGRKIVAVGAAGQLFLAPDNGILPAALEGVGADETVSVENQEYFRQPVSATFHGRDIFAPVAGHLSRGIALKQLGTDLDWSCLTRIMPAKPRLLSSGLTGAIETIDHFGNLITNIRPDDLTAVAGNRPWAAVTICLGKQRIRGVAKTYADAGSGKPLALVGSSGRLEIAVCLGNARQYFDARRGDAVLILTG